MPQKEQTCIVCDEAITNPICHDCLGMEMEQWFATEQPTLAGGVAMLKPVFADLPKTASKCIVCGNRMRVCSHCFCKEMYLWIIEQNKISAEKFLETFNYELKQSGPLKAGPHDA